MINIAEIINSTDRIVKSTLSNKDFDSKFQPVLRELNLLQRKINQQEGWFIFKTHAWTKEELLESEHISKIYSITEKIGDDVKNWETNKQLSFIEKGIYKQNKEMVYDELHATQCKIIDRKKTFWEELAHSFGNLIPLIMDNLPDIISGNITSKLLDMGFRALLPGNNRNNRRLPSSR